MRAFDKKIALTIPSRTESLIHARDFVSAAAREFGFPDEEIANIVLSVDEACTNIIKHAYEFAPDKEILLEISRSDQTFEVCIQDKGRPFDPEHIKQPDLKQHLAHYRRGGLGVYLMRRLMDSVEYRFIPGKWNEVRLVKLRPGHSGRT